MNAARGDVTADKARRKIPNERRLDRLGGETKRQEFVKQQAKTKEVELQKNRER